MPYYDIDDEAWNRFVAQQDALDKGGAEPPEPPFKLTAQEKIDLFDEYGMDEDDLLVAAKIHARVLNGTHEEMQQRSLDETWGIKQ